MKKYVVWERKVEVRGICETLTELENKAFAKMDQGGNFTPDDETEFSDKTEAFDFYEAVKTNSYIRGNYSYFCEVGIDEYKYNDNDEEWEYSHELARYAGELEKEV